MKIPSALLRAGFAIGCAACVSPTGATNEPVAVTVIVGQEFVVAPDAISFRLDSVVNDSRCPIEVLCVQGGSVVLKFAVASPAHPTPTTLLLDSTVPDTSSGVRLTVTNVEPVKHQNTTIAQSAYLIHLQVQRL
jgi:hypothetical protein